MHPYLRFIFAVICIALSTRAKAVEVVAVRQEGKEETVEGRLLVEAEDGGVVLLGRDGMLWALQPDEIVSRTSDERPFEPLSDDEMGKRLLQDFPDDFRVLQTAHYTICYNTSPVYAQWCGSLYERLYRGFFNYWKNRGWSLHEPEFRLVALVFDRRESFAEYARPEVGEGVNGIIGYYNLKSNRVTMYDLTGVDGIKSPGRVTNTAHINQILSQPAAERTVATIIHEATHQLAYNCGLQTRMADNPFWVSEGLAVYFEAPDYKSEKGWRTIGAVNHKHLDNFRQFLPSRTEESLFTLVADDRRFRDGRQITNAYSEAWALNYFLLNRHRDAYVRYLKKLSEKKPLLEDTPEERIALFKGCFGEMKLLDAEFLKFIARVR